MPKTRSHAWQPHGTGFTSADAKPIVTRTVPSRSVVCPQCAAPVDQPCVTPGTTTPVKSCHVSRRRMAVRKLNTEEPPYRAEDVLYAQRTTRAARHLARKAAKLSQGELAAILSVPQEKLSEWERGVRQPTGYAGALYGCWLRDGATPRRPPELP